MLSQFVVSMHALWNLWPLQDTIVFGFSLCAHDIFRVVWKSFFLYILLVLCAIKSNHFHSLLVICLGLEEICFKCEKLAWTFIYYQYLQAHYSVMWLVNLFLLLSFWKQKQYTHCIVLRFLEFSFLVMNWKSENLAFDWAYLECLVFHLWVFKEC